jgi:hypothetical protein
MTQNCKGLRGAPLIRDKASKKNSKKFLMLFDAILTVVFGNVVFDPSKIIQGTCLGTFFSSKSVFGKVTYNHWKGKILSSHGKKAVTSHPPL